MIWSKFINKPHPFIFNKGSVILPGIVTFLLITLLAPFGFQDMALTSRLGFAALFGVTASLAVLLVVMSLKRIYLGYSEQWTVGKEMLLVLGVISVICLLIFFILFSFKLTDLSFGKLFRVVLINTVVLSLFPVIILVLFEQYNHQKSQWKKATEMSNLLNKEELAKGNEQIQLFGENGKIELQLNPEELIFLKSDGNYVEVIYGDQPEKKLLRNRLKTLAEELPEDLFFQCHKSFVVNKQSIVSVEGNARNFELKLRGVSGSIPVSRAKSEELIKFLKG